MYKKGMRVTVTLLVTTAIEADTETDYVNRRDELLGKFKAAGFEAEIEEELWDGLEPDIVIAPTRRARSKRPTLRIRPVKPPKKV